MSGCVRYLSTSEQGVGDSQDKLKARGRHFELRRVRRTLVGLVGFYSQSCAHGYDFLPLSKSSFAHLCLLCALSSSYCLKIAYRI